MKELNNINSNNTTLNQTRIKMERLNLLEFISKSVEKNMTFVKYIFFGNFMRFGNILITIKKIIFFCRIIGCKRIFLDKGIIWFIKKKIVDKKYKIIIESKDLKNIKFLNLIIDRTINFFYYFNYINPDLKIPLIKDEILNNLPILKVNKNDLYIYIRSGDIFNGPNPNKFYSQAPLCFYQKILDKNILKNI